MVPPCNVEPMAVADGGAEIGARYAALLDVLEEAYCVDRGPLRRARSASDYRFLEATFRVHAEVTGLVDPIGRWMKQMAPAHEPHWFAVYGEVARTGEPARFQNYAGALGERWYDVLAYRVDAPELHHAGHPLLRCHGSNDGRS